MSKLVTLKQNVEFNHAYNRGKVRISPALVTYAVKSRGKGCRGGILLCLTPMQRKLGYRLCGKVQNKKT